MANEVKINVSANTADATKKLSSMSDQMKAVGRSATIAGGAILAMGAGSLMQFSKLGDQVHKLAMRTGFSTETLSELRLAAELSGTSLESLEKGIGRMQRTLLDASEGMVSAEDAIARMGLSAEALQGLNPEEQFEIMTTALARMEDPSIRAATAMEVFGRAGTQLLPMLAGGEEGLEAMKQQAHDLGLVFDQEAANKAAKLTDGLTTLKGSVTGVMLTIAGALAPAVTSIAEKIEVAVKGITEWTKANPEMTQVIVLAAGAVGALLAVLGPVLMILPGIIAMAPAVGASFHLMLGPVGLVTGGITLLVAGIVALKLAWDKNLGGMREVTARVLQTILDGFISFMRLLAKPMDALINIFNKVSGKSIPTLTEALDNLSMVTIDFGQNTEVAMQRAHMEIEKTDQALKNLQTTAASPFNMASMGKHPGFEMPTADLPSGGGGGGGHGGGGHIGGFQDYTQGTAWQGMQVLSSGKALGAGGGDWVAEMLALVNQGGKWNTEEQRVVLVLDNKEVGEAVGSAIGDSIHGDETMEEGGW